MINSSRSDNLYQGTKHNTPSPGTPNTNTITSFFISLLLFIQTQSYQISFIISFLYQAINIICILIVLLSDTILFAGHKWWGIIMYTTFINPIVRFFWVTTNLQDLETFI